MLKQGELIVNLVGFTYRNVSTRQGFSEVNNITSCINKKNRQLHYMKRKVSKVLKIGSSMFVLGSFVKRNLFS